MFSLFWPDRRLLETWDHNWDAQPRWQCQLGSHEDPGGTGLDSSKGQGKDVI